jgi:hypothetical protein
MSVSVLVALDTEGYEVLSRIIAQAAPRLNAMDLKIHHAPARLTTPSISQLTGVRPDRVGRKWLFASLKNE